MLQLCFNFSLKQKPLKTSFPSLRPQRSLSIPTTTPTPTLTPTPIRSSLFTAPRKTFSLFSPPIPSDFSSSSLISSSSSSKKQNNWQQERNFSSNKQANPLPWLSLFVLSGFGLISLLYYDYETSKNKSNQKVATGSTTAIGEAKIGGPFSLVDHNGRPIHSSWFEGRFLLMYFGFTFCPDICPRELIRMVNVIDLLEAGKNKDQQVQVEPIFITVDPARDTVEQVRAYVQEYHPRLIGLTGTPEQVSDFTHAYRLYVSKSKGEEDYLVDHSVFFYLVGPDGKFITHFGTHLKEEEIANKISLLLAQDKDQKNYSSFYEYLRSFFVL